MSTQSEYSVLKLEERKLWHEWLSRRMDEEKAFVQWETWRSPQHYNAWMQAKEASQRAHDDWVSKLQEVERSLRRALGYERRPAVA